MTRTTIDFGIDLGTTNSAIAVLNGVDPIILKNNLDQDITPSAVSFDKRGSLYVGDRAKKRIIDKPNDAFVEFKRRMGTEFVYDFKESGLKRKPEELSAEVLKELRADVARNVHTLGEEIQSAVITVPAAFELHQCDATKKAAELAGLKGSRLVQEPVAAALAYGFQIDSEKAYWLVYDFGGGTFDAALIKAEEGLLNVVHHGGDNFLGGSDIDWAIVEKIIIPKLAKSYDLPDFKRANDSKWGKAIRKLKWSVEAAKIDLSTKDSTPLDCTFEDASGNEVDCSEITLTRNDVIRVAEPIIQRSVDICRGVLKEKSLSASGVQRVILVGGPTKAPYFRDILREGLGIPIDHSVDPLTVVARGAAVFAGTQKLDAKLRPAAKAGEFKVDLKYKPVGHDTEPLVGGKVSSVDGMSVEGFTLEFVNERTKWRSGKITLRADGAFVANLLAEKGERNRFTLELNDSTGISQKPIPPTLNYTVGAVVEEQPLINSIGIGLATNEVVWVFEKGAGLPLKKKIGRLFHTTQAITAGQEGAAIAIPIIEGDNDAADRNRLVGVLEINSTAIRRDLPVQSEVELTLRIDESRIVTVNAYVPVLDEEFETPLDPKKKSTVVPVLIKEHKQEQERLKALVSEAGAAGDSGAEGALEKIKNSPLVQELKEGISAAEGDADAAEKGERRLLELKLQLDEIENKVKWPKMVADARRMLENLDKLAAQFGSSEQRAAAGKIKEETEEIIREKQTDRLALKITKIDQLHYTILFSLPEFWTNQFVQLQKSESRFSDKAKAKQLFEMGQNYLAQQNVEGLHNIVVQLYQLLPRAVEEEIKRTGFGAGIH